MSDNAVLFPASDRLGLMLFLAALAHLALILGVNFVAPSSPPAVQGLDVTLVQTETKDKPVDAQLLAQANSQGGGTTPLPLHLRSPFPVHRLRPRGAHMPEATVALEAGQAPAVRHFLTAPTRFKAPTAAKTTPKQTTAASQRRSGVVNIAALDRERAQLSAQLSRSWQAFEHEPRERYISASTRASRYARYMDAWKSHIERIGNHHYPADPSDAQLRGRLLVDVAINADGTVHAVHILHVSGSPLLAKAARQIVELAAPFAPFPPAIRRQADILHITRTWVFQGHHLSTTGEPPP